MCLYTWLYLAFAKLFNLKSTTTLWNQTRHLEVQGNVTQLYLVVTVLQGQVEVPKSSSLVVVGLYAVTSTSYQLQLG